MACSRRPNAIGRGRCYQPGVARATLRRTAGCSSCGAPCAPAHLGADLRCDDHVVMAAATRNLASDDRLGLAALMACNPPRVRVRSLDKIESRCDERVEQSE